MALHPKQEDNSIWIINGPNLNLLGKRETEHYGNISFDNYLISIRNTFHQEEIRYFQSNHEGALIDKLQEIGFSCKGIIFNPAAYTHTSIALADTVKAIDVPVVEIHISDIYQRETFRHTSYIEAYCIQSIIGMGLKGYESAVQVILALGE